MELIDDEGRLFGRVNVIDALVVLLIAAVVVGAVGPRALPVSPLVLDGLLLGGILALVVIGEGRV